MQVLFICNGAENLGVEYISSVLESYGYKTHLLFDPAVYSGDQLVNNKFLAKLFSVDTKIIKKAMEINPDVIAFSVYTGNYRWCLKIAKAIKKLCSIPIVFGGVHSSSTPITVLRHKFIDYVILGEGEYAMLDLVEHIKRNASQKEIMKIPNLCLRYQGKIHINSPRAYINCDSLPPPTRIYFMIKCHYSLKII